MKRVLFVLVLWSLLVAACGSGASAVPADMPQTLRVTDGSQETSYTVADLEKMAASEATFSEVTYKGVTLSALLADAGFDAGALKAVKATAADGYSVNYDPALFQRQDVLVAYATADGPLAAEDGVFRMVLPGEEGKLNVRMLTELKVVP
jgi:DMSO/TMAO reductase YedYZ molybdopterin-dependent catalytic subunit